MDELIVEGNRAAASLESVAEILEQANQPNQASECRRRADALEEALGNRCGACGGTLDTEASYDKHDPRNSVVGDDVSYHLGCLNGAFDEVYAEVNPCHR